MNYIIMALAGLFSGLLGGMGLGGGSILVIYLTLVQSIPQSQAAGINLLFFIPSATIAILYYIKKKMIDWKVAIVAIILGAIGGFLGAILSNMIDGYIISKIFGILLLVMGIQQLFYKQNKSKD